MSKRRFIDLILLAAVVVSVYIYRAPLSLYAKSSFYEAKNYISPCSEPLTYRIGELDPKFGLTKAEYIAAIEQASKIWEEPIAKDLFVYSEDGWLKINLIYDYRQETSNKLQTIGTTVEGGKAAYDAINRQLQSEKSQYMAAKSSYDTTVNAFKVRYDAYQEKVRYWNQKGGAPRQEYSQMKAEEVQLQSELAAIKIQESEVNQLVSQVNATVAKLNTMAKSLNLAVDKYNTVGSTLGESFEEGLYHSEGLNKAIDIYEFKDQNNLVRVLAHELGHALDLEHVDDPTAIMYGFNQGRNLSLSSADLKLIKDRCKII